MEHDPVCYRPEKRRAYQSWRCVEMRARFPDRPPMTTNEVMVAIVIGIPVLIILLLIAWAALHGAFQSTQP